MATLSNINGKRMIQFPALGKPGRATIRLGKIDNKTARAILEHVERLLIAKASGQRVPLETAEWLGTIDGKLHAKVSTTGLVPTREEDTAVELDRFIGRYIDKRTDLKPRTVENLKQSRRVLAEFFGKRRDLRTINRGEAADWRRKLAETFAQPTVAMHVKKARQFFADAQDRKLVTDNPFKSIKAGTQRNADRQTYIPTSDIDKVLAACPSPEWKAVFALARFSGLRVPSETSLLKWSDVDFVNGRITVTSPKTEHHEGRERRLIPLTPDVRMYLTLAHLTHKNDFIVGRLRGENLRTTATKIVKRAGLKPWAKLFQNLRASCETDLTTRFPLHVACEWIGNTEAVAIRHYLQVTDTHFADAVTGAAKGAAVSDGNDRTSAKHQSENPRKSEGFAQVQYPQGDANCIGESRAKLQSAESALQNALQTLTDRLPAWRSKKIAELTAAIEVARASAPSSPPPSGKGAK